MKLFLDSANLKNVEEIIKYCNISGITTNPTLIAKEGKDVDYLGRIIDLYDICKEYSQDIESISIEVISTTSYNIVKEVYEIISNIKTLKRDDVLRILTIKLPLTKDGLVACKELSKVKVKINMTLIFTFQQAILAINNGARYVSPFIGRLDDIGYNGLSLISEIDNYLTKFQYETEIIGASIRNLKHINDCAMVGCDIVTVPPKLIDKMIYSELTEIGLNKFLEDYKNK